MGHSSANGSSASTRKRELRLAATAPSAGWANWHTAAWLTLPEGLRRSELQILVHGAGYDHRYWDWPADPEIYSYVDWAESRGRATLALDRIGAGLSSRPPGSDNTVLAQAEVLRQVVASARRGLPGAPPFERVVLVGHSLGSVVCGVEAASFGDVDALVLTGYLPVDHGSDVEERFIEEAFVPAVEGMPHLRGLVDDNYLASRPGNRGSIMYRSSTSDPGIIAVDEEMKDTTTRGELRAAWRVGPEILKVAVPTLVLVGEHDLVVMDHGRDRDCYDSVRHLETDCPANFECSVVPGVGHSLNLHRAARDAFDVIDHWLDRQVDDPAVPSRA